MSMFFALFCVTHDVYGPELRRGAGGVGLWRRMKPGDEAALTPDMPKRLPVLTKDGAEDAWSEFLIEHESCELHLHNERVYLPELVARRLP